MSALIQVHSLVVEHPVRAGFLRRRRLRAVDGVDLELGRGEILGLVGESGCGKSTLARAIVGLTPPTAGGVLLDGVPVPGRRPPGMRRRIQMIYQDPGSSLDPRRTVAQTLAEPLRRTVPAEKIAHRARELLEMVGLGQRQAHALPRELSGGQRQRVAIARALAVEPEVLVADEAVAALDASVAGAVLNLLSDLRERLGLSVLFISHDLATVRGLCDRVAVMYLGSIVEEGPVARVFARPGHPYTRVLLDAVPSRDRRRSGATAPAHGGPGRVEDLGDLGGLGGLGELGELGELRGIAGEPPSPLHVPPGCRFHPRCPRAAAVCGTSEPSEERRDGQRVWCHFAWRHEY
ncbi:oligopeptide/dipeptide ABC transporter ATP-binding protein [Nonomuraea sp. NPDC050022]|uniref:oligopeptide/dipeptide ABC transporter ATP-binding protein n=1 Tax=Nonomuraea sp. NPDC050022 TaxID=3364358 RepID=UPI0037B77817